MRRGYRGTLLAVLLVLAALAGGYWYAYERAPDANPADPPKPTAAADPAPAKGPPPVSVEAAAVTAGVVTRTVNAVGTLRSNESVIVRPEIAGRIAEIHFNEGERVKKGAPLVTFDGSVYRAELAEAEARHALARQNSQRANELFQRRVGTARTRDEALAGLRTAEAEIALAKARLDKTRLTAPFEGVLGLRRVSVGDYLNPGQEIVNLEDLDPIKVDFRIPATALGLVRDAQPIEVQVDGFPDATFTGEVYAIDPRIDVEGRSVALRARIPNPDHRLMPGLFGRVSLIVDRREDAMLIPEQAVVPLENRTVVFKVVDGKAVQTEVRLGQRRAGQVEIVEGLRPGDLVVTAGQMKVRDGVPVQVERPAGA